MKGAINRLQRRGERTLSASKGQVDDYLKRWSCMQDFPWAPILTLGFWASKLRNLLSVVETSLRVQSPHLQVNMMHPESSVHPVELKPVAGAKTVAVPAEIAVQQVLDNATSRRANLQIPRRRGRNKTIENAGDNFPIGYLNHPLTYDSFSATFPLRTRKTSTPRTCPPDHV